MFRDPETGLWMVDTGLGEIRPATPIEIVRDQTQRDLDRNQERWNVHTQVVNPRRPNHPPVPGQFVEVNAQGTTLGVDPWGALGVNPLGETPVVIDDIPGFDPFEEADANDALLVNDPEFNVTKSKTKTQATKIQDVIQGYNKIFEEVLEQIFKFVPLNEQRAKVRCDFYNSAYFMDDAFEKALMSKSKGKNHQYSIWFKDTPEFKDLNEWFRVLEYKGYIAPVIGNTKGIRIKKTIVHLNYNTSRMGPEERFEELKRLKAKVVWFMHQGSWYEPLTGRAEIMPDLLHTKVVSARNDVAPFTMQLIEAWLKLIDQGFELNLGQFHHYLDNVIESRVKEATDTIKHRIANGLAPFPTNETAQPAALNGDLNEQALMDTLLAVVETRRPRMRRTNPVNWATTPLR